MLLPDCSPAWAKGVSWLDCSGMGWMALAMTMSVMWVWQEGGGSGGMGEGCLLHTGQGLTLVLRVDSELRPCGELWSSLDTTHRNSAWSSLP